jgi:cytochrome c peroxidase
MSFDRAIVGRSARSWWVGLVLCLGGCPSPATTPDAAVPSPDAAMPMPDAAMPIPDAAPAPDAAMPDAATPLDAAMRPMLTDTERAIVATLSPLPALPADPTNAYADDPDAARLGQRLFFDARYSGPLTVASDLGAVGEEGRVSCATCHGSPTMADDRVDPVSIGTGTHFRNAPALVNSNFYQWTNWGGRFAAQWELPPIVAENGLTMNSSRLQIVHHLFDHYRTEYEAVFGPMDPAIADLGRFPARGKPKAAGAPDGPWEMMTPEDRATANRIFVNYGKAIHAYQRLLVSRDTPFDRFVAGEETAMSESAIRGLQVFVGRGRCVTCHNGPTLSDDAFHNLGVPPLPSAPFVDDGRFRDVPGLLSAMLGANGAFSDDMAAGAARLAGLTSPPPESMRGTFRTPSLRGLLDSAPYMHAGQLGSLHDVVDFYDRGGDEPASGVRDPALFPLGLTAQERDDLVALLFAMSGEPIDPALRAPLP